MELYDVMRTTFAARDFTDDPLPDDTLAKILDHARFAPSGGNRQGWKIIVVRDQKTKDELARFSGMAGKLTPPRPPTARARGTRSIRPASMPRPSR